MKTLHSKSVLPILTLASLLISLVGGAVVATPAQAVAAGIIVNSLLDTVADDGNCTLREAIQNADENSGRNIDCTPGSSVDPITFSLSGTITLGSSLPAITDPAGVTIDGSSQTVIISGDHLYPVLLVNDGASLSLNNLTIADGNIDQGGGIYNSGKGMLTITNSTITGNNASGDGGGVFNLGNATITSSTFSGNSASGNGGGVYNAGGNASITSSTFSGNSAGGDGGGIYNNAGGSESFILNSTFAGNTAAKYGGGAYNTSDGTLAIMNSTFKDNVAGTGGGIYNLRSGEKLANTILANNTGGNCGSTVTNGGNNIDDGATCGFGSASGSMSGTNPLLGSLANYGGPTQTFALLTGSPAIDGVTYNAPNSAPSTDQRGVARPQGDGYDIGAFESEAQAGPAFIVNTNADTNDGFCDPLGQGIGNQDCTLREAITAANALPSADSITFSFSGTITLGTTLPGIADIAGLTMDGTGQTVTISGNNAVKVLYVGTGAPLILNKLTIANGRGMGAGIRNNGTLTITNSIFSGNNGPNESDAGGGIYNAGTLTITNSTFSVNTAAGGGAGIFSRMGTVTITNTTFSGNNSTYGMGGGGFFIFAGTATITNSTFSGNLADYSTGSSIFNHLSTVTLRNTIVANSASGGGNCYGTIINGGNNIDDGTTCGWESTSGSMSSTLPDLGALANNGGPTPTFALLTGSPAIDGMTYSSPNGALSTDQRGAERPQGLGYDIGAYELFVTPLTPTLFSPSGTVSDTHPPYIWDKSNGASSYHLAVFSFGSASYVIDTDVSSSSCTGGVCTFHPATTLAAGNYQFKVLASNIAGSSTYSAWMAFTVPPPPATPVLISPSGTISDTHPPYVWNASTGATSYTVAVYSNGAAGYVFTTNVSSSKCTVGVCTYHPATVLPLGAYRFKVLARSAVGASPYSAWKNFGIPPATPVLISPSGTISDTHPPYVWNASTGATSYTVAVYSNGAAGYVFTTNVSSSKCTAGVCTYHPATVLPAGAYRFKVLARNAGGASPYSAWKNFAVSPSTPPAAPSPISPDGTISDHHPPYTWTPSSGATSYTISVWSNASLSYVFVTNVASSACTGGVCTYHPATTLAHGSYRFKVLARNAAGASAYSAWMNFTVSP